MSRTSSRQGTKSSRRAARTLARARRREAQLRWWTLELKGGAGMDLPKNLRRRWARRGLLGGAS